MTNKRLAILGAGNMGRALIGGLLRSGTRPEHISVGEPIAAAREALARELGIAAAADNAAAVSGAAVVVLAVKPQDAAGVLTALAGQWGAQGPLLISVAAGLRVATLQAWCGPGVAVVRAIPNRPALVGAAVTGLFAPPRVAAPQRATAEQLLGSVGEVVWVPTEDALDVVTALSGSGPGSRGRPRAAWPRPRSMGRACSRTAGIPTSRGCGPRSPPAEARPRRHCACSKTRACAPAWRARSQPRRSAAASWPHRTRPDPTAGDS